MSKVNHKERAFIEPLAFGAEVQPWKQAKPGLRWTDSSWKPEMPPDFLDGEAIGHDFEYDPDERSASNSRPFAFSVYSPKRKQGWYLPWGHEGGGNLPEEQCKAWAKRNLANRDVHGLNVKAEMHMLHNWGIDPAAIGCRPHDVAFRAALLNENRYKGFSLEALATEYLPENERKVKPEEVPPQYFKLAHAGFLAERGVSDSYLAWRIHEETESAILAEALEKVNKLEDDGILAVTEMERNGALIDRPKLEQWVAECEAAIATRQAALFSKSGRRNFAPGKSSDMDALFATIGVGKPNAFDEDAKQWKPSWGQEALEAITYAGGKRFDKDGNRNQVLITESSLALEIKHYQSMLSKYFYKYLAAIDSSNVMRFSLHQMRNVSEFGLGEDDNFGTVTGRFSCGGGKYAINIQQVMKCEKQIEMWGDEYVIRELFRAQEGRRIGASDASQIEFRLFSHYSGAKMILDAYRLNPMEDFHLMVTKLMKPGIVDEKLLKGFRKHMKHNNFGVLYGMGREKLARRLGLPCTCSVDWREERWDERRGRAVRVRYFSDNKFHEQNCKARQANDIMDEYAEKFPDAGRMLDKASARAKEIGFVRTLLGRRRRFPDSFGLHKALNAVIQGSAADVFKWKMIQLFNARKDLGILMRMPVHDEFVYDIDPDPVIQGRLQELLDEQSFDLKAPLLWESGFGMNWREANHA